MFFETVSSGFLFAGPPLHQMSSALLAHKIEDGRLEGGEVGGGGGGGGIA